MDASVPTIRSLSARAVIAPLERPVRTAVGTIPAAPLVLIDIETDQGVPGRAYLFAYTPHVLRPLTELVATLGEQLRGKRVAPRERWEEFRGTFRLLGCQGLLGMALSGLDMALWDILGRSAGRPLVELLGGSARPLPAYDSYGAVDPRADRAALEASLARGFEAIKIKVGGASPQQDLATAKQVREIIGPKTALMVDFNQSQSAEAAIARLRLLADCDLAWVEEPVPAEDWEGHARVRTAQTVPVQTGENWWFVDDMAKAIAAGACDYAMPDLMKIGGVSGWQRAAAIAAEAKLPLSSHIFVEASAHVLAVTPTCHWLEYLDLAGAVLRDPMAVVGGKVTARGPGLGLEWDERAVKRCAA